MTQLADHIRPVLKTKHQGQLRYEVDPMDKLKADGLAIQVGNGIFVLHGFLAELIEQLDAMICKIARQVKAAKMLVPTNLSLEKALMTQYLSSFQNQALMLSEYYNHGEAHSKCSEYYGMASPTVCYHVFSSLKGRKIKGNFATTALSRCSRKEQGELNDLSRLVNFTMREIVFLGDEHYCLSMRDVILDLTLVMLNEMLDITYEVMTAADPFFGEGGGVKKMAQLASQSKYEIQALLPFSNKSISIASFNLHGQVFYDRFDISSESREQKFSGCVGWGYERLLYAILAQKGMDFDNDYYNMIKRASK